MSGWCKWKHAELETWVQILALARIFFFKLATMTQRRSVWIANFHYTRCGKKSNETMLICFWKKGNHPHRIYSSRTNCQPSFLYKRPWKAQKKGHLCETRHYRQINAPSWQRPMSHCPHRHRIFDLKMDSCGSPDPYSPDHSSCELFRFPKLKMPSKDVISGL